jgi:glyoxalase family protein
VTHSILGLHHVTATADGAQEDLDFYVGALGLRLVKKTVNFDNHHVFHFYYGNETGTPGTIWTTFPYRGHGVRVGRKGAGQITVTSFAVPAASLEFWFVRLASRGISVRDGETRFGEKAIVAADPSGLLIELVGTDRDARGPWSGGGIEPANAIRGLHSVTMTIAAPERTIEWMTRVLGFVVTGQEGQRTRLSAGGDAPGHYAEVVHDPAAPAAINGTGTVHHVAFAIATGEEQRRLREDLVRMEHPVTEVRDRQYFTSIYFREPGGVLFEVATVPPGFEVDESLADLGRGLKLPPWEEPHRAAIEAGLPAIR